MDFGIDGVARGHVKDKILSDIVAIYAAIKSGGSVDRKSINGLYNQWIDESNVELEANSIAVMKSCVMGLGSYADFWNKILAGDLQESWGSLCDTEDYLNFFVKHSDGFQTRWILRLCKDLGFLFPHKLFCSIEAIGKVACSICGLDPLDGDCPHIPGNLYRGRVCSGVITQIDELPGISLTETPRDRRCTVQGLNHDWVERFSSYFRSNNWSPMWFCGFEYRELGGQQHVDIIIEKMMNWVL